MITGLPSSILRRTRHEPWFPCEYTRVEIASFTEFATSSVITAKVKYVYFNLQRLFFNKYAQNRKSPHPRKGVGREVSLELI